MLLRSNISSFPQYFRYISNVKSPIKYKFVKCDCSNYCFLNSDNLICRGTDISKCFRVPLEFEITRVDFIFFSCDKRIRLMRRLFCVFVGRICQKVRFLTLSFICLFTLEAAFLPDLKEALGKELVNRHQSSLHTEVPG